MNLLVFEGVDQSGKTTVRKCLRELYSNRWLFVDRWIHSHLVYGGLLERYPVDIDDLIRTADSTVEVFDKILVVICQPPIDVVVQRMLAENPTLFGVGRNFLVTRVSHHLATYREAVKLLPYPLTIYLDTSRRLSTVVETLARVVREVEENRLQLETLSEVYELEVKRNDKAA